MAVGWNKGLTKDTDERLKKSAETYSELYKGNGSFKGKKHSEESKEQIRQSMLKAHKENRAHKWTRKEPSHAEKTFLKFLDSIRLKKDIDFVSEFPFFPYKVDFYFPKYNFVIELDGKQHTKYPKMVERDIAKDKLLKEKGVTVLRINWRSLFHNSKETFDDVKNILSKLYEAKIDINEFSYKQAKRLNILHEYEEKKKQKILDDKMIKRKKFIMDDEKLLDVKNVDLDKYGSISLLKLYVGSSLSLSAIFFLLI